MKRMVPSDWTMARTGGLSGFALGNRLPIKGPLLKGLLLNCLLLNCLTHCFPIGLAAAQQPVPTTAQPRPAAEKDSTQPQAAAASAERIAALIADLGHEDYFVRERAQQDLLEIGFEAFDALTEAENHDDLEVAARAKYLVRRMRIEWILETDPPAAKALMANYDSASEKDRIQIIEQLDALPADGGIEVLCRMVRFEKSPVLSKFAALAIIRRDEPPATAAGAGPARSNDEPPAARRQQMISRGIGGSQRPGAQWLRVALLWHTDAASAVDAWGPLAAAEEQLLHQSPHQTREEIVVALGRQHVTWLNALDRRDEALAAMMKLAAREPRDSQALHDLIEWIVQQQAFSVLDDVAQRFADRINEDSLLLYALAQARTIQGKEDLARQAAERALKLHEGDARQHFLVADALQQRGRRKWSEGEFARAVELGEAGHPLTLFSRFKLAELMHDRGDDQAAATALKQAIDSMETNIKQGREEANLQRPVESVRARMLFFESCHLAGQGDPSAQLDRLKQAIDADPLDADVLIALYRATDVPADLAKQTLQGIREAAEEFQRQIAQSPEEPTSYNQFAWLISNTEGDQKQALEYSLKSLELVRASEEDRRLNEAGYLDTLARCYYAQGDYQRAVEQQSQAVALDPESGLMNKQLSLFKEALAAQESP